MRPSQILAAVVAFSSATHAISDAFDNIHGLVEAKNVLFGRQNNDNNNNNDSMYFMSSWSRRDTNTVQTRTRPLQTHQPAHSRQQRRPISQLQQVPAAVTITTTTTRATRRPHQQQRKPVPTSPQAARHNRASQSLPASTLDYPPVASPWSHRTPSPERNTTRSATG